MRRLTGGIRIWFAVTRSRYGVDQSFFFSFCFSTSLKNQDIYYFKKELHIERKSANRFIFVSLWLNCRFYSLESAKYLRPPGRRFGIIKPLTLDESPACLKEPRCVFVPRSWFKSAINLATEEQVRQAVESRDASCCKTKHPSWTYGSFAKLRCVFWKLEVLSKLLLLSWK